MTTSETTARPQTFADHIHELRGRLFWVALFFVIFAVIAFPFFDSITKLLLAPLGDHKLYYMTPAGGLSFTIKICLYVATITVLPVVAYHLYKFFSPLVSQRRSVRAIRTVGVSVVLACTGITFAYTVSLPAALHFLTNMEIQGVGQLITLDSYISFVAAYLVAGALLFQIPLLLLVINSITPLSPTKLMSYQRHLIVGSFIVAAIVSPTPDVVNQTILALPMVLMYQIGVVLIWLKRPRQYSSAEIAQPTQPAPAAHPVIPQISPRAVSAAPGLYAKPTKSSRRIVDGVILNRRHEGSVKNKKQPASHPSRRNLDGFAFNPQPNAVVNY